MYALLIALVLTAPTGRGRGVEVAPLIGNGEGHRFRTGGTVDRNPRAPLFAFASPNRYYGGIAPYAGLPASDGCYAAASVTGTKGEALTFTRATTRFCPTDGTTSEATGVMCSSGQVCITSLSGKRGISVFRAGTNKVLRSEEIDNASWGNSNAVVAAPTLNGANAAVAPDGTTTAEDYTFPATSGAGYSSRFQGAVIAAPGTNIFDIWVKGQAGSGTTDVCIHVSNAPTVLTCADCAFTTTWKRCSVVGVIPAGGAGTVYVGNMTNWNGGTARAENRVYVWGAQGQEAQAYLTPYVKTEGASATRNAEVANFAAPTGLVLSPLSVAATRIGAATSASQPNTSMVNIPAVSASEGSNVSILYGNVNGLRCYNNANIDQRVAFAAATEERAWCDFDHANGTAASRIIGAWPTGSAMSDSVTASGGGAAGVAIQVGQFLGGGTAYQADGLISGVCVDLTLGVCR